MGGLVRNDFAVLDKITRQLIFYDIISIWFFQAELIQKRFYTRGTNSTAFCVIQQMFKQIPLPFYATQIINPFLNKLSQPIMNSLLNLISSVMFLHSDLWKYF